MVPFRSDSEYRDKVLDWVLQYWHSQLPDAEIIIGESKSDPFSKTEAFNDALNRSTGEVIVLLDADAYFSGEVILKCAARILEDIDNHLWYVPYNHMYRLNQKITEKILDSDPTNPLILTPTLDILDDDGSKSGIAHRYGAMIMMFPREAYDAIRCFDERFAGWGGEDIATLKALDTLYGKHKIAKKNLYHLWHPKIGDNYKNRKWAKQEKEQPNSQLAMRYHKATRNPSAMKQIVDEAWEYKNNK